MPINISQILEYATSSNIFSTLKIFGDLLDIDDGEGELKDENKYRLLSL
jgi:hypothetical protein